MASAAEQLAANLNVEAFSKATELHKRLWFTVIAMVIYRVGCYVPIPGIDIQAFSQAFQGQVPTPPRVLTSYMLVLDHRRDPLFQDYFKAIPPRSIYGSSLEESGPMWTRYRGLTGVIGALMARRACSRGTSFLLSTLVLATAAAAALASLGLTIYLVGACILQTRTQRR